MQVTDEVAWDAADFALFGAMLIGAGGAYELAARTRGDRAYRAGVGVALAAAFVLVWMTLAVGLIGTEADPANLLVGGVLMVGIVGAIAGRFEPRGMASALRATAWAQALAAVVALVAGSGSAEPVRPGQLLALTGFFAGLWLLSAWLFGRAAREKARPDAPA